MATTRRSVTAMARTMDTSRGLDTLGNLNSKMTELGAKLHQAGVPWDQIGEAVGTTRQGAAKRFGQTSTGRITGRRMAAAGAGRGGGRGRTGAGRNGRG